MPLFEADGEKELEVCTEMVVRAACACSVKYFRSYCGKRDCGHPDCNASVSARRAFGVLERLEAAGPAKKFAYTVFTVPDYQRAPFIDPEKWGDARRFAASLLKHHGKMGWAVEASHPVGDLAPGEFHPHLNFIWKRRDATEPWLDLAPVKAAWTRWLEEASGLGAPPMGAVVQSQFYGSRGQMRHKAFYVTRLFPGLHAWTGNIRYYGDPPKRPEKECGCEKCGCAYEFGRPIPMAEWGRMLCRQLDRQTRIDEGTAHLQTEGFSAGLDPPGVLPGEGFNDRNEGFATPDF